MAETGGTQWSCHFTAYEQELQGGALTRTSAVRVVAPDRVRAIAKVRTFLGPDDKRKLHLSEATEMLDDAKDLGAE